uniref:Uncharacterized protein n=2 Tax=Setaria italica TaxID=4555 RepID=K3XNA6_SETIT
MDQSLTTQSCRYWLTYTTIMKNKFSSCPSSLPALLVVAIMLVAIAISGSVVHCSEVVQAAHDATVAHPEGGRWGMAPPAPQGGPVHAYDVPPPPEPRLRRLLHHRTGRSAGAGSDV